MKLNTTLILILVVTLAAISGIAWTAGEDKAVCPRTGEPTTCTGDGPHGPRGMMGQHHRPEGMAAALDLTDEQREAVREIMAAARQDTHQRMEAAMTDILTPEQQDQLEQIKTSRGTPGDLERSGRMGRKGRRGGDRGDMATRRLEHMTENLDLTPDQQEQVRQIIEESTPPPRSEVRDRIRAVLTPEQQEMMDQHQQQRPGMKAGEGRTMNQGRRGSGKGRNPRGRKPAGGGMGLPGHLDQQLDLTDEQRAAIRETMAGIQSEQQEETRSRIEALLTPEQVEKLEQLHQD